MFTDVTGSTELGEKLDPESMRHVMSRYFDAMRAVIERHGGTVEKFIGDAVMAVFGVPQLHEDDAVRGVRAAVEMQEAIASLNNDLQRERGLAIMTRTGVNTGEVLAGGEAAGGDRFVTGDAVNVAARFEQAARPGEILIGAPTLSLVRDAVEVEPVEALALKGKSEPVPAFRLLAVRSDAPGRERRLASAMVGRERQLRMLEDSFEAAVADRRCHLFTVLGSPGVGKSRLVLEFLDRVRDRATIHDGRCLSYGDGITFWPVAEIVREAAGVSDDHGPEGIITRVRNLLSGADDGAMAAERIENLLGVTEANPSLDEIFWAIRKLFEHLARDRPLVVVIDDIHWAEPTLLDLIEHVADWTRDAPVLLLCMARPELLEVRPNWGGGKLNAASILLEPLSADDCEELIANLLGSAALPPDVRGQILKGADGNPLFVEEMLGMLIDDGLLRPDSTGWILVGALDDVAVPASIHALLAARLDRLTADERATIERGSVEGPIFHVGGVEALSSDLQRAGVRTNLMSMVRKELIRPNQAELAGEDAFRFHHLLLRDAAYEAMPKEMRADLHERFADWLADRLGARSAEAEAIVAYHLEQAVMFREALGTAGPREEELAGRAAERYAAAAKAALDRGDAASARNLLDHARSLRPADPTILFELASAMEQRGDFAEALATVDATDAALGERDDLRLRLRADLLRIQLRARVDKTWEGAQHLREARRLLSAFEELGDEEGMAAASLATIPFASREENLEAAMRAYHHAERAADTRTMARALAFETTERLWGPTPAEEGVQRCDVILSRGVTNQDAEATVLAAAGCLHAMRGDPERGRTLVARSRSILLDLGSRNFVPYAWFGGYIAWFFGEQEAAIAAWREGYDVLSGAGEKNRASTLAAIVGLALAKLGRDDEALEWVRIGREAAQADDEDTHSQALLAEAVVSSNRRDHDRAASLARDAVRMLEARGLPWLLADAHRTLGDVLVAADRISEAREEYREALAGFEAKGVVPLIAAMRTRLDSIG